MKYLTLLRAYIAHDDPATAVANVIAMIVGWNAPFYPFYVMALVGRPIAGSAALTAIAAPFFLAIPALARVSSRAARMALPIIGTTNTLWCIKLLGHDCGLAYFLLPCIVLSALIHRRDERLMLLLTMALPLAAGFLANRFLQEPLILVPAGAAQSLAALNEGSVLVLACVIAWRFAALLRNPESDPRDVDRKAGPQ